MFVRLVYESFRRQKRRKLLAGAAIVALAIVVALPIGAAAEPGFGEDAVLDFALFLECDFVFENIEFRRQMRRHLAGEPRLPLAVACLHIPYTTSEWGLLGKAGVGRQ